MNNFEFAIKMEETGEEYYRKMADMNKDNGLHTVFLMMAEDEAKHAKILVNNFKETEYELVDNQTLEKSLKLFEKDKEYVDKLLDAPSQLKAYREALENEKTSIELYKKMFEEAQSDRSKELFEFLIKEEMDHHNILEELVLALNKAEEWVESAEFGKREEY